MKPLEKVLFLQKSYNLNDRSFCSMFHIKYGAFKKWKKQSSVVDASHLTQLCKTLELDLNDFMSDNSTLCKECMGDEEHLCAKSTTATKESFILEDFPREDNSRYEEKD